MSLSTGTRLGPYEIQFALGSGGMGEVYRARDTRLERVVAIKVLAPRLASDAQFRARFENEARAISALEHAHICALYDVGEEDGTAFIVMQYLEGETLAVRLAKGPLPVAQALRCGMEIADALAVAHRAGIVHRDLKPGNIMMTKSGAKLLDFGLAKAASSATAASGASMLPTTPPALTAHGTILGTFQYMAPEQLEGMEADSRTDIFAFGAVLYEMLTGRKAFEGRSQASVIAAILDHEPPLISTLQPLAPPVLDRVIKACLAKDPDQRWQSAADVARELAWIAELPVGGDVATAHESSRSAAIRWSLGGVLVGILAGAAGGYALFSRTRDGASPSAAVARVLVSVAPADQLRAAPADQATSSGHLSRTSIALSPDGRTIVFSAVQENRQLLYARPLDQLDATPLAGTDGGSSPFFSPDGQWVGFWANGALKKIALSGGTATTLCETTTILGASWGDNDVIVFANERGGLWRVPAVGGSAAALTRLDENAGEVSHRLPQVLPGGAVMFTVTRTMLPTWDDTLIVAQPLSGGTRLVLVEGAADGRYAPDGRVVYARRGTLNAAPFDLEHLRVTGGSVTIVPDLMQSANMNNTTLDSGAGQFSVSASGSLAYVRGGIYTFPERALVWVDRTGRIEPLPAPPRAYIYPRLSVDGSKVLVSTQGDRNVWLYDISRGTTTRLTVDGRNMAPIWTPDDKRVTFGSSSGGQENLYWKPADGSGSAERLTNSPNYQRPSSWSPDGRALAFITSASNTPDNRDILILSPQGKEQPQPLFATRFDEQYPEFSPDGRWIAYASNESGRSEMYVAPYPGPGPKVPVSAEGGHSPAWTRNGRELIYLSPLGADGSGPFKLMSVSVTTGQTFTSGRPSALFETPMGLAASVRGYDVTADGRRFLMVQPRPRSPLTPSHIVLVQNWSEELKAVGSSR